MSDVVDDPLSRAGDALHRAWQRDLTRSPRLAKRRTAILALAAVLVVGASTAVAASLFKSPADEQNGIQEADTLFVGSNPHCVTTSPSAFRCTLDSTPQGQRFYAQNGSQLLNVFLGMKMPTTNADHVVDGGCVGRTPDGRVWDCYLGAEAVARGVVSSQILGHVSPGPTAG
jgi:hypothetical protein